MTIFSRLFSSKPEPITLERFNELRSAEPRRLCFGTTRKLSRGTNGPATGFLNLNFRETIDRLLPWDLERFDGKFGRQYRRVIRSEAEYCAIEHWIGENADVVFIRSLLGVCVAAGEHQSAPGNHTVIGDLERRAKYTPDNDARANLLDRMEAIYRRLLGALEIDALCAVPPTNAGEFCLPVWLAAGLSQRMGVEDLSPSIGWTGTKPKMKEVDVDHKWATLESVGLTIGASVEGRRILIIDDLYQSGATVHFVASKLQSAGAAEMHCFAVVKSMRDTDNT
jgi:Phosphoribosyl transferase domain